MDEALARCSPTRHGIETARKYRFSQLSYEIILQALVRDATVGISYFQLLPARSRRPAVSPYPINSSWPQLPVEITLAGVRCPNPESPGSRLWTRSEEPELASQPALV